MDNSKDSQAAARKRDRFRDRLGSTMMHYLDPEEKARRSSQQEDSPQGNRKHVTNRLDNMTITGTKAETHGQSYAGLNNVSNNYYLREEIADLINEAHGRILLTDPTSDKNALISRKRPRATATCEWIKNVHDYQAWVRQDSELLYVCGEAGKGKTMLSLFILEELEELQAQNAKAALSIFYFCAPDDEKRNKATSVLRSLIYQLVSAYGKAAESTLRPFFDHGNKLDQLLPNRETLWTIFTNLLKQPDRPVVWCLVDGLDACDDDKTWLATKFLDAFPSDREKGLHGKLQAVLVSQEFPELRQAGLCVNLEDFAEDIGQDIERAVRDRLDQISAKKLPGFDDHRDHIETTLLKRANGTFAWVGSALETLLEKGNTSDIMRALDDLPPGVHAMYQRALHQVPLQDRDRVRSMLEWTSFAARPLNVREVADVAGITPYGPVSLEATVIDAVKKCGVLLRIDRTDHRVKRGDQVRPYLTSPTLDDDDIEFFRLDEPESNLRIAAKCLDCIQKSPLRDREMREEEIARETLLEYAVSEWPTHARLAGDAANRLLETFTSFFARNSVTEQNWWHAYSEGRKGNLPFSHMPAMHKACFFGILPWVDSLLDADLSAQRRHPRAFLGRGLSERSIEGGLPISCAIAGGHTNVVQQLLLHRKAQVGGKSTYTCSGALHMAALYGHANLAELLIDEQGAKVDAKLAGQGSTALHLAAGAGNLEVTKLLLARGAEVNAKTTIGRRTPLHEAAGKGAGDSVITLLIKEGANINAGAHSADRNQGKTTPLHEAILGQQEAAARLLLENGADPNVAPGTWTSHPLYCALPSMLFVNLLIDHGADVEYTPAILVRMAWYISPDFNELVDLLIRKGADINAVGPDTKTPLQMAVYTTVRAYCPENEEWSSRLRFLLARGADPNLTDSSGRTILMMLITVLGDGNDEAMAATAELLIEHGADVEAKNKRGQTALALARKKKLSQTVKMLSTHRTKILGGDNASKDSIASTRSSLETMSLLSESVQEEEEEAKKIWQEQVPFEAAEHEDYHKALEEAAWAGAEGDESIAGGDDLPAGSDEERST